MYMKKTIVRRGEEPEILSVERNPKEPCKADFPNHCYAVVSKCYEGAMLAVIRGTNLSLLVDDAPIFRCRQRCRRCSESSRKALF